MRSFFKYGERGFTLIELLVVIGIFALITTIVFIRQSSFSGSTLLTNVAYQVALTLRQAQVYGLSVREFSSGDTPFNYPYGVHFDKSASQSGGQALNTMIAFFVDTSASPPIPPEYDPQIQTSDFSTCGNGSSSCLELLTMSRGNYIRGLCAVPPSGSTCDEVDKLDISFVRPDPEARIVSVSGSTVVGENQRACIRLSSLDGVDRYVAVRNTGQISVSNTCQ